MLITEQERWVEHLMMFWTVLLPSTKRPFNAFYGSPTTRHTTYLALRRPKSPSISFLAKVVCSRRKTCWGIQVWGPALTQKLVDIFQSMWEQGVIPHDFKDASIVHMHLYYKRKGNRQTCDNHQGTSLLSIPGKILKLESSSTASLSTFNGVTSQRVRAASAPKEEGWTWSSRLDNSRRDARNKTGPLDHWPLTSLSERVSGRLWTSSVVRTWVHHGHGTLVSWRHDGLCAGRWRNVRTLPSDQ